MYVSQISYVLVYIVHSVIGRSAAHVVEGKLHMYILLMYICYLCICSIIVYLMMCVDVCGCYLCYI